MSWITDVVTGIFSVVADPIKEWQKRETLKVEQQDKQLERQHELNLKKADAGIELAKQGIQIEANWDNIAQNNMQYTWKDEYLVIIFTIPLILAFIPDMQPYVKSGFEAIKTTPEWYRYSVMGIVMATFGLRWYMKSIRV